MGAPLLLLWALCSWLRHLIVGTSFSKTSRPLNVLVTGGKMSKASAVARAVGRSGHRVFTAEILPYRFCHTRFSTYVTKHFVLPRPLEEPKAWLRTIQRIVREEDIDLVIPCTAPVESSAYAHLRASLPVNVRVFAFDAGVSDQLDHKFTFNQALARAGLPHPRTALMESTEDAQRFLSGADGEFICKPAVYDPEARTELKVLPCEGQGAYLRSRAASRARPYVLQEVLEEPELGCYSIFSNGKLTGFTLFESCASCLVYRPHPDKELHASVLEMNRELGRSMNLTGQLTLDLMVRPGTNELLPIECNPRIHSAVCMLEGDGLGAILAEDGMSAGDVLDPDGSGVLRYWVMDQVFLRLGFWKHKDCIKLPILDVLAKGGDALLHGDDPMPFLAMYLVQIPLLLLGELAAATPWLKIDFCIGKIVKAGGD